MKLNCPEGVKSINVGGTEYTAVDGVVEIGDPIHVAAAQGDGFVEAPVAATVEPSRKQKTGE